jgi:hypothetical protein
MMSEHDSAKSASVIDSAGPVTDTPPCSEM